MKFDSKCNANFVTVHQCMSDAMRKMREAGQRVIAARGGFNQEGVQGWTLLSVKVGN